MQAVSTEMHIPQLWGLPACVADMLFKFPLHFADLNTARVAVYGVHITHIKLLLGSACFQGTHGRKSIVATGGMDFGTSRPQQGVKTREEHPQSQLEWSRVWELPFEEIHLYLFHEPQKNQENVGKTLKTFKQRHLRGELLKGIICCGRKAISSLSFQGWI